MKAIVIEKFGGPEVLQIADLEKPAVGPGQLLIKVEATSVNRPDIVQREGNLLLLVAEVTPSTLWLTLDIVSSCPIVCPSSKAPVFAKPTLPLISM